MTRARVAGSCQTHISFPPICTGDCNNQLKHEYCSVRCRFYYFIQIDLASPTHTNCNVLHTHFLNLPTSFSTHIHSITASFWSSCNCVWCYNSATVIASAIASPLQIRQLTVLNEITFIKTTHMIPVKCWFLQASSPSVIYSVNVLYLYLTSTQSMQMHGNERRVIMYKEISSRNLPTTC